MNTPKELKYSASHEWIRYEDETTAYVGITDYAQSELGDIVYVNIPYEGDAVKLGESFTDLESVKAVAEIYSPFTGEIVEVNERLETEPEAINNSPYDAWIVKVGNISETEALLSADEYDALCNAED